MKPFIIYFLVILFYIFIYRFYKRSPKDNINYSNDSIYSPSYGEIMKIIEEKDTIHICIFLRPTDIHYQYFPCDGKIKDIIYDDTGVFNLAYKLNKSNLNEKCIHILETSFGNIEIYQIAGFLARRISYFKQINDEFKTGEKLGIIHLGSRVDMRIPKRNFKLEVKEGQKVVGGITKIGIYMNI